MRQFSAIAASVANSTALRLSTGSAPGRPRHTGQTWVLGAAPNAALHPQKILDAVRSCAWISRPITGSYVTNASGARSRRANLRRHIRLERLEVVDEHARKLGGLGVVV